MKRHWPALLIALSFILFFVQTMQSHGMMSYPTTVAMALGKSILLFVIVYALLLMIQRAFRVNLRLI